MTWDGFISSVKLAFNWILGIVDDMVSLFSRYPVMFFLMFAGVVYLVVDSLMLVLSGHGFSFSGSSRLPTAPIGTRLPSPSTKSDGGKTSFRGKSRASIVGYNGFVGGRAFVKNNEAGLPDLRPNRKRSNDYHKHTFNRIGTVVNYREYYGDVNKTYNGDYIAADSKKSSDEEKSEDDE